MAERITGVGPLRATFMGRKVDVRDKTGRRIVAAGGGVLRKEARRIVVQKGLVKSRALLNNIAIKRERNVPAGIEQYNLGVRHGRDLGKKAVKYLALGRGGRVVTRYQNDPFYWRFLELGHKLVARARGQKGTVYRRTKDGKMRKVGADSITVRRSTSMGFVPATPFIAPALENKRLEVLAAMEKQALKLLDARK